MQHHRDSCVSNLMSFQNDMDIENFAAQKSNTNSNRSVSTQLGTFIAHNTICRDML